MVLETIAHPCPIRDEENGNIKIFNNYAKAKETAEECQEGIIVALEDTKSLLKDFLEWSFEEPQFTGYFGDLTVTEEDMFYWYNNERR